MSLRLSNRDRSLEPRGRGFWCGNCDHEIVNAGSKCSNCGAKAVKHRSKKPTPMFDIDDFEMNIDRSKKFDCCKCDDMAVWEYAPCDGNKDVFFCDVHVPRGCSCTDDYTPCIEYWYWEDGIDK